MDTQRIGSPSGNAGFFRARPIDDGSKTVAHAGHGPDMARDDHHDHHGHRLRPGAALQIFRQELRMALRAQFRADLGDARGPYEGNSELPTPGDVADEALGVARQVVAQSPTTAARSLAEFRSRMAQSVDVVKQTTGAQDELAEVDQALVQVDHGLAAMEEEAAATRDSSTSVLDIDMQTRQRSRIRIRTQEGDVVKLSLKQVTEFSASSSQVSDGGSTVTATEIDFSSRSRMVLSVRGDLNDAELGAIKSVVEQAQQVADAFFGGDIGAAFENAGRFAFDSEQLANIDMRFRMRQVSNVAYAETVASAALPRDPAPALAPVAEPAPTDAAATPVAADAAVAGAADAEVPVVDEAAAKNDPAIPTDAIGAFVEMVGSFLRSVSEGFEGQSGNLSIRYQHTESFKLRLLQSVLHTTAPREAHAAAAVAIQAIEQMSGVQGPAGVPAER